jgi:RNA methyltransferase, TrmH family
MATCCQCPAERMRGGPVFDPQITPLTSLHNPRIKQLVKLRDRSERDNTGLFLIEGYRELLRAADQGYPIQEIYICPAFFLGSNEPALLKKIELQGARLFYCSEAVFKKISYRDRPDGLLGLAAQRRLALSALSAQVSQRPAPFLVVAEAIEKPGNLGTILRSSDAVRVDGLILADRCTDLFNPNVVRASVGTLFTVPVYEASAQEALHWLKAHNIPIAAATPHAQVEFTKMDFTGPIAIAVGTEQLGLSDLWMQNAEIQVKIPMLGVADSLNVAMATTLLLYEVARQRQP